MSEVAALEDVCERAWPPRERIELDGAVLRFTDGFTRRANSARVDAVRGDLGGLIARAEREYRSRGLRPGFRLTPLTPPAFERLLERARIRRRHRGRRDGGGRRCTMPPCRRRREAIALAPALDDEWLQRLQGSGAQLAARAGSWRALGARLGGRRRVASRSRASTVPPPRPGTHDSRATGSTSRASDRSPSTAGGGSRAPISERLLRLGRRRRRRASRSCRSRRKTRRRRGFMRSSASARATSTATSCRVRSRSLTNTPFWASQGPGG